MAIRIEEARAADLPLIEALQVASWQNAYRGMVSDAFLGVEVPRIMARKWAALPGADWIVLVARAEAGIAGFAALEMGHDGGPYVDNLHVAPSAHGRGIGRALMAAMAGAVAARGGDRIWLTVIRENTGTRAFYRRIGGIEGPEAVDDLFGQSIVSIPVHWADLPGLAAQGAK